MIPTAWSNYKDEMRWSTYMPNIVTAPKIAHDYYYHLLAGLQCLKLSSVSFCCHSAACWSVLSYLCGSHDSELCLGQLHLERFLSYSGQGISMHVRTLGLEQHRVHEQSQTWSQRISLRDLREFARVAPAWASWFNLPETQYANP